MSTYIQVEKFIKNPQIADYLLSLKSIPLIMKKILLVLLAIISHLYGHSQRSFSLGDDKKYLDSISNIVETTTSDSIKCQYSYRLSKLFAMTKDFKKVHVYLDRADSLVNKFLICKPNRPIITLYQF